VSRQATRTGRKSKEAYWRELIARQVDSGRSIAAFCREQHIASQTFYWWRSRLGQMRSHAVEGNSDVGAFIDLGAMRSSRSAAAVSRVDAGIDIRVDLPGGISLTITRR
jgi:hypothetical protein